jgi:hypothetical protein
MSYPAWSAANGGRLSWFDYAAGALHESRAPEDLVLALARILWPTFVEVDGLVFLSDSYSSERVEQLRSQGLEGAQLEHWMNLFCLDGLVPTRCEDLAPRLLDTWRAKLGADYPTRTFDVKVLRDEDVGDVCITFFQTATP